MQINNKLQELPVIKVQNLNVYRGQYLALHDISFQLKPGTDTAIVGPNGAGKSTLIQAILGLIKIQSGQIEIFGRSVDKLGNWCHQIGYMPQNFIFDRNFPISVQELVGLGWVSTRQKNWNFWQQNQQKKQAITIALKRVKAEHLKTQPIGTLSGGELKRVLLAYCLVIPRQLLVLDEAFAGVDMRGSSEFYQLLNDLKKEENWTVLQISHDIDMVSKHCDHVLCLNRSIICEGKPEITLSEQNLTATYGLSLSRYRHHH
jgi:zinc transport system ATP-binding protein